MIWHLSWALSVLLLKNKVEEDELGMLLSTKFNSICWNI